MKYCLSIIAAAALMVSCSKNNEPKGQEVRNDLIGGSWTYAATSTRQDGAIEWRDVSGFQNGGKTEYTFDGKNNLRIIEKNSSQEIIAVDTGKFFVGPEGDSLKMAILSRTPASIEAYGIVSLANDTLILKMQVDVPNTPPFYYLIVR